MDDTNWVSFEVRGDNAPPALVEEIVGAFMAELGAAGADQPDDKQPNFWRLYFSTDNGAAIPTTARFADIAAGFGLPSLQVTGPLTIELQPWHENWRQYFKPVQVTPGIRITPPWEAGGGTGLELLIEPGMAFGTGTHATTQLCLALLEKHLNSGDRVLDVGTGSGILAIAAAKLGAVSVIGTDNDPDVFENAALNAELNHVPPGAITFEAASPDAHKGAGFDIILCNMLSREFIPLLPELHNAIRPGGLLILSGLLTEEETDIIRHLASANFSPIETRRQDEWSALVCRAA